MTTLVIHYPSGGFGHYVLALASTCYYDVYQPKSHYILSESGDSHSYPTHYDTWFHYEEGFSLRPRYDFSGKKSILLVDSGIEKDHISPINDKLGDATIIRLCINDRAKSIVSQTCKIKAEKSQFEFDTKLDWERRERFTIWYHHIDKNDDYYLNGFQPLHGCINLMISDLFDDIDKILDQLSSVLGSYDNNKVSQIHENFLRSNARYNKANELVDLVKKNLAQGTNDSLCYYDSLHDQGFLNYWLEKTYGISEIPPYDYKNWFSDIDDIRHCITKLKNV